MGLLFEPFLKPIERSNCTRGQPYILCGPDSESLVIDLIFTPFTCLRGCGSQGLYNCSKKYSSYLHDILLAIQSGMSDCTHKSPKEVWKGVLSPLKMKYDLHRSKYSGGSNVNSVHTRRIVKTSGFTRAVCKNRGFYQI